MQVRWDAVVRDNDFWSECPRRPGAAPATEDRAVSVQVWLFGALNDQAGSSPVTLQLHGPFSVNDVIAELGRVLGRAFLDRLTDSAGVMFRICRVFVDGEPVEDMAAPIGTAAAQTTVELILLTAAEGG